MSSSSVGNHGIHVDDDHVDTIMSGSAGLKKDSSVAATAPDENTQWQWQKPVDSPMLPKLPLRPSNVEERATTPVIPSEHSAYVPAATRCFSHNQDVPPSDSGFKKRTLELVQQSEDGAPLTRNSTPHSLSSAYDSPMLIDLACTPPSTRREASDPVGRLLWLADEAMGHHHQEPDSAIPVFTSSLMPPSPLLAPLAARPIKP
jgi:hypothetical protein